MSLKSGCIMLSELLVCFNTWIASRIICHVSRTSGGSMFILHVFVFFGAM